MKIYRQSRAQSVAACGAAVGSVVRGSAANNQGVRIRVLCEQPKGHSGTLRGAFVILDAGNNKHTQALLPLLRRETDAAAVQRVNRRDSPSCVRIANAVAYAKEEKDERQ